jgi:hypothetical protein
MTSFEKNNGVDIIDTESVTQKLKTLESNIQHTLAIGIIKWLESTIENTNYDLDLAIDRENNKYYIISGIYSLNIPLSFDTLVGMLKLIIKGLNANEWREELLLRWKENKRTIIGDWGYLNKSHKVLWNVEQTHGTIIENGVEKFVNQTKMEKNNNKTEEIYKFIQSVKWVPIEEWDIKWVCNWPINNECKKWLWFGDKKLI